MKWHRTPLRISAAMLLLASAIVFPIATSLERSKEANHIESATAAETAPAAAAADTGTEEPGAHAEEGAGAEAPAAHAGETPAAATAEGVKKEKILGIDIESPALTAAGVALSVLLAAGLLLSTRAAVTLAVIAFGLAFAVLDLREAFHQVDESRTSLVVLAVLLTAMHLAVALLGWRLLKSAGTSTQPATV
jgi:hypothetical protein